MAEFFLLATLLFSLVLLGLVGHARWRQRRLARRPDHLVVPAGRAAIIMPSKGCPPRFAENLRAFATQTHPDFALYVCVEAADDPGSETVSAIAAEFPLVRLVVAGLSEQCSQQNHNMLAGITAARAAGAVWLAFADNDFTPPPHWLSALLRPLGDPTYNCSTGYRWVSPASSSAADLVHAQMNAITCLALLFNQATRGNAVWGGSFALSLTTFDEVGLGARWAETISDDLTLLAALQSQPGRCYFCPDLLLPTTDVFPRVADAIAWYARQMALMRIYFPATFWGQMLPTHLAWNAALLALPGAGVAALVGSGAAAWLAPIGLLSWGGFMGYLGLLSGLAPVRNRLALVISGPVGFAILTFGIFQGAFGRDLLWGGRFYTFDRNGRVTHTNASP